MGLMKAGSGAPGNTLAEQWKESFYCDALPNHVLMRKGEKRVSGRSSNTKGTDTILSNDNGSFAGGKNMKKKWKNTAALLFALLLGTAFLPADAYALCENGQHDLYQADVYKQTCTTDGYYILRCRNCEYYERVVTEKAGHSWEIVYTEPATCTTAGKSVKECSACGANVEETISPSHKFGAWMVLTPATCTQDGIKARECDCGYTERASIPATGKHTFGAWMVLTPANCMEEGIKARECDCGYTERASIPATGKHTFGAWMVLTPANCMEEGIKARECDCGYTERAPIPITDHAWEEGIVEAQPSTTSEGVMLYVCSFCGMQRTRPIPKLTAEETATPTPSASPTPEAAEETTPEQTGDTARGTEKGKGGKLSGDPSGESEPAGAETGQAGLPIWAVCLIALAAVLLVVAVVIIVMKKKRE